jgi:hypothetical protein
MQAESGQIHAVGTGRTIEYSQDIFDPFAHICVYLARRAALEEFPKPAVAETPYHTPYV